MNNNAAQRGAQSVSDYNSQLREGRQERAQAAQGQWTRRRTEPLANGDEEDDGTGDREPAQLGQYEEIPALAGELDVADEDSDAMDTEEDRDAMDDEEDGSQPESARAESEAAAEETEGDSSGTDRDAQGESDEGTNPPQVPHPGPGHAASLTNPQTNPGGPLITLANVASQAVPLAVPQPQAPPPANPPAPVLPAQAPVPAPNPQAPAGQAVVPAGRNYNRDLFGTLPATVSLPPCDIGAVELLTFFPNHTQWPEAGLRLYRNQWAMIDIASGQLYARGNLSSASRDRRYAAMRQQMLANGKEFFNDPAFTTTGNAHQLGATNAFNGANYAARRNVQAKLTDDSRLLECVVGVVNWPTGSDRGIVTQCVELANATQDATLRIRNVPLIAAQHGFVMPAEAALGQLWDTNARARTVLAIRQAGGFR